MPVLLSMLLSSAGGYGFEVLDTTDEEWVAPGYVVVEEAVIDPLEYGEPYTSSGTPTVGVHLSFEETDSIETWKVVLVMEGRVVVLREGELAEKIPVDLDIASCAFSPSGRYVVVHDGAEEYTGRNAARIDTQSGDVRLFDSQPNGLTGPRGIKVSDGGIVSCGYRFFGKNLALIGELDVPGARWNRGTLSPSGEYYAVERAWISPSLICLFSTDGSLLWQNEAQPLAFASLSGDIVFSPDEQLLAVPLQTGLEVWDVSTGDAVWRDDRGNLPSFNVMFMSGSSLVYSSSETITQVEDIDGQASRTTNAVDTDSSFSIIPYAVASAETAVVAFMQTGAVPRLSRCWTVLDSSLMPIWISSSNYSHDFQRFGANGMHLRPSADIGREGSRLIHTAVGMVRVISIRSLP